MRVVGKKLLKVKPTAVYDPEVSSRNPCFELAAGIFSHNTVPWGSELKDLVLSRFENGMLIHMDGSQMEVRVLAAMANEETLLEAFRQGKDVHRMVAAKIWKKEEKEVTGAERRFAKMACLVGSTPIKCLDGSSRSIESLYQSYVQTGATPDVYSFDIEEKAIRPGNCVEVQLTKYVTETVRVTFENGKSIEVTPDHPLLQTSGYYGEAAKIPLGTEIETLFYRVPEKGAYAYGQYEQIRDVRHSAISGTRNPDIKVVRQIGKWHMTHHMVAGYPSDGFDTDHINDDTLDNRPSNLQTIPHNDHQKKTVYSGANCRENWHENRTYREFGFDPIKDLQFDNYRRLGLKVVSIETVKYDNPIPVYDLSVDTYRNYAIDLGEGIGVFVHNTFSLLYGKTVEGFGQEFMGGDIAAAVQLFDDFFEAFPKVRAYIEESHDLLMENGEVPTMWGDPIVIEYDPSSKGSVNSAKRQAQNYRIQSTASNVMAVTLSRIQRMSKSEKQQFLYKLFGFTHDSTDIDTPITEALMVLKELPRLGEQLPREEWNLPVEVDIEIGISGNKMMVVEAIGDQPLVWEDGDDLVMHCEFGGGDEDGGSPEAVSELVRMFKENGGEVECEITKEGNKYTSLRDLFMTRRAYSLDIGHTKKVVWGHLKVRMPKTVGAALAEAA